MYNTRMLAVNCSVVQGVLRLFEKKLREDSQERWMRSLPHADLRSLLRRRQYS